MCHLALIVTTIINQVPLRLLFRLHGFPSTHHRITIISHLWGTDITIISNTYLTSLVSLLRRNDDDTICRTGTINSRCGSILQNLERINIVRIYGTNIHILNTVYDDQRVRPFHRTDTTDTNSRLTRRTSRSIDINTRRTSLQCLSERSYRLNLNIVARDYSDRSCNIFFRLRTITNNDDLIQSLSIFL